MLSKRKCSVPLSKGCPLKANNRKNPFGWRHPFFDLATVAEGGLTVYRADLFYGLSLCHV